MAHQSHYKGTADGFLEEEQYLLEVLSMIDEEITSTEFNLPAKAAHQETADSLQKISRKYLKDLQSAKLSSHFGRVDFIPGDNCLLYTSPSPRD